MLFGIEYQAIFLHYSSILLKQSPIGSKGLKIKPSIPLSIHFGLSPLEIQKPDAPKIERGIKFSDFSLDAVYPSITGIEYP